MSSDGENEGGQQNTAASMAHSIPIRPMPEFKVAPYGFDCVEHNHVQKFIIFSSYKVRSQNSAT